MAQKCLMVLGLVAISMASAAAVTDFVETGGCPPNKNTEDKYKYTLKEMDLQNGDEGVIITCSVLIKCVKAGTFGEQNALLYDLVITDVSSNANEEEDEGGETNGEYDDTEGEEEDDEDSTELTFDDIIGGWFKFVQTDDGKIPAVFHPKSANQKALDFKKAVSNAFQSNFKGTDKREETDTQSKHLSEYKYKGTPKLLARGSMQVHRRIVSADVEEYASHIPGDVVDLDVEEDQEFNDGVMTSAKGDTNIVLLPTAGPEDDIEGESLEADGKRKKRAVKMSEFFDFMSNTPAQDDNKIDYDEDEDDENTDDYNELTMIEDTADEQDSGEPLDTSSYDEEGDLPDFSAKANYKLELLEQRKLHSRERREAADHLALPEATQSTLMAQFNHTQVTMGRMAALRLRMKDITSVLDRIHSNPDGKHTLINYMVELISLEAMYGSLPRYTPATEAVIAYLPKLIGSMNERDSQMRALIYLMLSRDGSTVSQKTLVGALDTAVNEDEEKTIVAYIAFTQHPQPQMISELEHRIGEDVHTTHPLLLAYGSLVARASPDLQQRMTLFLMSRLPTAESNTSSLLHHIFSLGNTESHLTTNTLLDYLHHPEDAVQISSIHALRYATGDGLVQKSLNDLMAGSNVTGDHISAVLHSLLAGVEHASLEHTQPPFNLELALSLTSSVLASEDKELHILLTSYLNQVGSKDSLHLLSLMTTSLGKEDFNATRLRRGTNWAQPSSIYDLVASLTTRKNDVKNFPYHKAYIWGKQIGIPKANLQVAAGGFIGAASDGQYKIFGRGKAVGQLFGTKKTLLDFLVLRQKTNSGTHTRLFAQINGKTLANIDIKSPSTVCKRYTKPLFKNNRFLVFDFSYPIRIVIASLSVGVKGYVSLGSDLYVEFCEKVGSLTAEAGLESTITLEVRAGVTGSLLNLARGGVEAVGQVNYKLTPALSTEVCLTNFKIRVKNCIGIYNQWTNNNIKLEVWYQFKKCRRWGIVPFCQTVWGTRRVASGLSNTWNLPSSPKRPLLEKCDKNFDCQETTPAPTKKPTRKPAPKPTMRPVTKLPIRRVLIKKPASPRLVLLDN